MKRLLRKNFRKINRLANFNPDDWQIVESSDPNVYQLLMDAAYQEKGVYLRYMTDGRYRYVQPISLYTSKSGNTTLFCYKENGEKRRYSLDSVIGYLFDKEFLGTNTNQDEKVDEIYVDEDLSENKENIYDSSNELAVVDQEMPHDDQISMLDEAISTNEIVEENAIEQNKEINDTDSLDIDNKNTANKRKNKRLIKNNKQRNDFCER